MSLAWDVDALELFIGDEFGFVKSFDMRPVVEGLVLSESLRRKHVKRLVDGFAVPVVKAVVRSCVWFDVCGNALRLSCVLCMAGFPISHTNCYPKARANVS